MGTRCRTHRIGPPPAARRRHCRRTPSATGTARRRSRPGQDHRSGHDHRAPACHRPRLARAGAAARHAGVPVVRRTAAPLQPVSFAIYDEERCEALRAVRRRARNPFEDEQLVIADFGFLENSPKYARQLLERRGICWWSTKRITWRGRPKRPARAIRWWSNWRHGDARRDPAHRHAGTARSQRPLRPPAPARSAALQRSGRLSGRSRYLSATVEVADRLLDGVALNDVQRRALAEAFQGDDASSPAQLAESTKPVNARELLAALIDRHGTGRAMFRNRRAGIGGFPKRLPEWHVRCRHAGRESPPVVACRIPRGHPATAAALIEVDYSNDPRIDALIDPARRSIRRTNSC
jgi:ATP-dependent helicase HepA